jgi:hypothetical protein
MNADMLPVVAVRQRPSRALAIVPYAAFGCVFACVADTVSAGVYIHCCVNREESRHVPLCTGPWEWCVSIASTVRQSLFQRDWISPASRLR